MERYYVGIDPGTSSSGVCIFDREKKRVIKAFDDDNTIIPTRLRGILESNGISEFTTTFEKMRKYGVGAGESVFMTCLWHGRFIQWLQSEYGTTCYSIASPEVKLCFLGTTRGVTKTAVKQAILELFPQDGGGKTPAIGTKSKPGSLYTMKEEKGYHHWDAFATILAIIAWQGKRFDGIVYTEPEIALSYNPI